MLKNARNYEQELQKKLRDTWYDLDYQFYHSSSYHSDLKLEDECRYDFVSVNTKDEIVGFFSYQIDREVNSVRHFGAISFDQNSVLFARDMAKAIDDIFNKYNFNRMEWYCIDGNPILDSYKRFCEKHGGIIMAHEHECVRTLDGQLRDSWGFEILKKNYVGIFNDGLPNQIAAHWCEKITEENEAISWSFETDIPHKTFMVYDDGDPFCEGIVFSIDDLV